MTLDFRIISQQKFTPLRLNPKRANLYSDSQQWNHINHGLFIRVNTFHGHDYPVSLINPACNLCFNFFLRRYFALSPAVRVSTFKRPPRSDDARIGHARIIFPDMAGPATPQSFLQHTQMRLRNEYLNLAVIHHIKSEYTGPEGLRSLFMRHNSSQTHEIFGTSPSFRKRFSGRNESLSLARVK